MYFLNTLLSEVAFITEFGFSSHKNYSNNSCFSSIYPELLIFVNIQCQIGVNQKYAQCGPFLSNKPWWQILKLLKIFSSFIGRGQGFFVMFKRISFVCRNLCKWSESFNKVTCSLILWVQVWEQGKLKSIASLPKEGLNFPAGVKFIWFLPNASLIRFNENPNPH